MYPYGNSGGQTVNTAIRPGRPCRAVHTSVERRRCSIYARTQQALRQQSASASRRYLNSLIHLRSLTINELIRLWRAIGLSYKETSQEFKNSYTKFPKICHVINVPSVLSASGSLAIMRYIFYLFTYLLCYLVVNIISSADDWRTKAVTNRQKNVSNWNHTFYCCILVTRNPPQCL